MLDEIAQSQVAQRISMVSGVAQVNIFGSQKFAVRVDVDPRELAARSIGIDEVAGAISNANSNLPTGTIYGDADLRRPLQRAVDARGHLRADDHRLPQRHARSAWTKWRMSTTASKTTRPRAGRTVNAVSTCRCRSSPA